MIAYQHMQPLGLSDFIAVSILIIETLAVYSYVFKKDILRANHWNILLWLAVFFVFKALLEEYVLPKDFVSNILPFLKSNIPLSRSDTLVCLILELPGTYALYKLSLK